MIQTKCNLIGHISTKSNLRGKLNNAIVHEYPDLEDLEITPSNEEQHFKSNEKYGYNNVTVKAVEGEKLEITPTPEEQNYSGLFDTVNVKAIETDELNIIPSTTEQVAEGIFNKVTVAGDSNLVAENIKKDIEIFGVVGTLDGVTVKKGLVINSYDEDGYPIDVSIVGMTEIPDRYFYYSMYKNGEHGAVFSRVGANLHLPNDLTSIGAHAFQSCTNLALTELPSALTSIGQRAFESCTNLALTSLPDGLISIPIYGFEYCTNLALTELPSGLTSIGTYGFASCTNLALTELPNGLSNLGERAFNGCKNLAITSLPSGVTIIPNYCFAACSNLTEILINGYITSLGTNAFGSCSKLEKIVLPNVTSVPTLANSNAFKGTPIANGTGYIYVPDSLVDSFKTATNWSTYADQIKGINGDAEKIEAINNMKATLENGELILEYDSELLDIDFYIEDGNLNVNNNETIVDFSINENKEMEAIY